MFTKRSWSDAYEDGRQARRLRKAVNDVPHARGTPEYDFWRRGWEDENRTREPNTYSVGDASQSMLPGDGCYRMKPTNRE